MLKEGEHVPEIYQDSAFARTSHWELSTSNLSSPYLDGWGYGEGELNCTLITLIPNLICLSPISRARRLWTVLYYRRRVHPLDHYKSEEANERVEASSRRGSNGSEGDDGAGS